MYSKEYLREVHHKSFGNKEIIDKSNTCGCFFCERLFDAIEVTDENYMTEVSGVKTAVCPYCGIDSVLGDGDGTEITEGILKDMYEAYFNTFV